MLLLLLLLPDALLRSDWASTHLLLISRHVRREILGLQA